MAACASLNRPVFGQFGCCKSIFVVALEAILPASGNSGRAIFVAIYAPLDHPVVGSVDTLFQHRMALHAVSAAGRQDYKRGE